MTSRYPEKSTRHGSPGPVDTRLTPANATGHHAFFDIPFHPTRQTLKPFGALLLLLSLVGIVFRFLGPQKGGAWPRIAAGFVGLIGIVGLVWPLALRWLFVGWMVAVFPIGWMVSQLVILLVFVLILTPMGILGRFRGQDPWNRGRFADKSAPTWVPVQPQGDPKRYLRQYQGLTDS